MTRPTRVSLAVLVAHGAGLAGLIGLAGCGPAEGGDDGPRSAIAAGVWISPDIVEAPRSMEELPAAVVQTIETSFAGLPLGEIEEVRYEGVPIVYEVEVRIDGRDREVHIRPDGVLTRRTGLDDVDVIETGPGVDDDDPPRPVAEALRRTGDARTEDLDVIRYEGSIVLYEAAAVIEDGPAPGDDDPDDDPLDEDDDDEDADGAGGLYIYPDGTVARRAGEVVRRPVGIDDLPAIVAAALRRHPDVASAGSLVEVRYEGIPIVYDVTTADGGGEEPVAVRPDGRRAGPASGAGIEERRASIGDLPPPVSETLRGHLLGGTVAEVEEIRYGRLVVLYEAEVDCGEGERFEVHIYPDGRMAERRRSVPASPGS
ncbi:MAG: hypothetical protein ACYTG1_03040 [Planctomycetota bacterium]|jgi:hypothetical protein